MDDLVLRPGFDQRWRFAWTVVASTVLIFLCLLWLRGRSLIDTGGCAVGPYLATYATGYGVAAIEVSRPTHLRAELSWRGGWHRSIRDRNSWQPDADRPWYSILGFGLRSYLLRSDQADTILKFTVPYWLMMLIGVAIALLPRLPWSLRFSLRTLLIATTIVSLVLGIWCVS